MVVIWSSGWGPRRRRRGYGRPPAYGYSRRYDRGGSCFRDLLLLNTGCCLANAIGCGSESLLLTPTTVRRIRRSGTGERGTRPADRLVAAVRVYQREISPTRPPCCSFNPTCSVYAVEALERHGAWRGSWLTLRRLVRCHPAAAGGADPVPA
jgi:putative membrane protein insertion efficiency factor